MPSRRFTSGGSLPPSCRYLWTASRPVKRVPLMRTSSPTLSERTLASEMGVVREIILIKPFFNFSLGAQRDALAAISPTHIADAHEEGGGQTVQDADLGAEQGGLAAETHRADAQFVCGIDDVFFEFIEFGVGIAVVEFPQELLLGRLVTGGAIAADANAEDARAAT